MHAINSAFAATCLNIECLIVMQIFAKHTCPWCGGRKAVSMGTPWARAPSLHLSPPQIREFLKAVALAFIMREISEYNNSMAFLPPK